MTADESKDGRISFQEFVEGVVFTTNSRGQSNARFRGLVDMVAMTYVKRNDDEVRLEAECGGVMLKLTDTAEMTDCRKDILMTSVSPGLFFMFFFSLHLMS